MNIAKGDKLTFAGKTYEARTPYVGAFGTLYVDAVPVEENFYVNASGDKQAGDVYQRDSGIYIVDSALRSAFLSVGVADTKGKNFLMVRDGGRWT